MVLVKLRTLVLPAYRKDTGRIPEGHRKGNKSPFKGHSEQAIKKTCIPEGYRKDTGRESKKSAPGYRVYFMKSCHIFPKTGVWSRRSRSRGGGDGGRESDRSQHFGNKKMSHK